ncbi:hypothetical protein ACJW30_02G072300 [Castanea mollissima]
MLPLTRVSPINVQDIWHKKRRNIMQTLKKRRKIMQDASADNDNFNQSIMQLTINLYRVEDTWNPTLRLLGMIFQFFASLQTLTSRHFLRSPTQSALHTYHILFGQKLLA